jgi:predicted Rossmann fold flavoprotein
VASKPDQWDVIVLGAGAAGLMCAFTAAQRKRRVLVLEKANKVGKKILMSGGGRCNFTNLYVGADNFLSANPHFCKAALNRYTQWDFIAMVERHNIPYEERKHGQLFCCDSASDILQMLLRECELAGVEIRTNCDVASVTAQTVNANDEPGGYQLHLEQGGKREARKNVSLQCESLVVATGALSIPTLGGSGLGYELAQQFGIELLPRRAGLVPFMFSDQTRELCERLAGTSVEVEISCKQQSFTEHLLFTHRGISGPAVLQISNYWHPGDSIDINLLPAEDASQLLLQAKQNQPSSRIRSLLHGHLPRSLVAELQTLCWSGAEERPLAEFADKALIDIGSILNRWRLRPSATEGYRTAEVTLGGIDTNGVSSKSMQANQQAGLYFIGEVLDVTGHLGGFNFQWAWSSGYTAGLNA